MPIEELKALLKTLSELNDQVPSEEDCTDLENEVCADIANLRNSLARLLEEYDCEA